MKPSTPDRPATLPLPALLDLCGMAVAVYAESPDQPEIIEKLHRARRETASAIMLLGKNNPAEVNAVIDLQRKLAASGAADAAVPEADLSLADQLLSGGPMGLLAAMLLVPASQWPGAPALKDVPAGLWPAYTAWLFHTPQGFCALGQAESYGAHYLRRLQELVAQADTQPDARHVKAAVQVFVSLNNSIPLYFSTGSLRQHMELRGRLLAAAASADRRADFPATPRAGRRLRVGFVNRHFGSQTETYSTLPTFEQLDPVRFEVQLFAHHDRGSALEKYAAAHAASFTVLPEKLEEQLKVLRAAALDVVVFGTNVTAVCHEVTRLALHRVAPLQVVNNSSCTTSGLTEIDLYVSGDLTETTASSSHFTERLGLLPGPAHAFNYEADRAEPSTQFTRAALGLTDGAMVFVSAANYFKILPEMRTTWARLLAAVPGSHLLLHPFNPNWSSSYPIKRFRAEMDAALAAHGVAASRLTLSTNRFPSRTDVKTLLAVGDVYLDTFPFGGVNSLVDPLELGMPIVAWEGDTMRSRMGAALLRQLGLGDLVARDECAYLALARQLAAEPRRREALREQIGSAMASPLFLDPLAASDLFGSLLERAYDELVTVGPEEFRRRPEPVRAAPGVPLRAADRTAHARELVAAGRTVRAVDYLLAAVATDPQDADAWFALAGALCRNNQKPQAVQALDVSLRIDPARVAAWTLLVELAETIGATDMATEARAIVRQLTAAPQAAPETELDLAPPHLRLTA
jgi:protein O-GlcNAc transferase